MDGTGAQLFYELVKARNFIGSFRHWRDNRRRSLSAIFILSTSGRVIPISDLIAIIHTEDMLELVEMLRIKNKNQALFSMISACEAFRVLRNVDILWLVFSSIFSIECLIVLIRFVIRFVGWFDPCGRPNLSSQSFVSSLNRNFNNG